MNENSFFLVIFYVFFFNFTWKKEIFFASCLIKQKNLRQNAAIKYSFFPEILKP